jgi:hypothetical protein
MAYQGLREKLFTKNGTKQELTWLFIQVTMVCASSIENFQILIPFLVDMCIFPWPTTFVTRFFLLSIEKMDFYFISAQKGKNRWFFVKWLPREVCRTPPPQFSHVGDLVGRQDPVFQELSQPSTIY